MMRFKGTVNGFRRIHLQKQEYPVHATEPPITLEI